MNAEKNKPNQPLVFLLFIFAFFLIAVVFARLPACRTGKKFALKNSRHIAVWFSFKYQNQLENMSEYATDSYVRNLIRKVAVNGEKLFVGKLFV